MEKAFFTILLLIILGEASIVLNSMSQYLTAIYEADIHTYNQAYITFDSSSSNPTS